MHMCIATCTLIIHELTGLHFMKFAIVAIAIYVVIDTSSINTYIYVHMHS